MKIILTNQMIRDKVALTYGGLTLKGIVERCNGASSNAVMTVLLDLMDKGEVFYDNNTGTYKSNLTLN